LSNLESRFKSFLLRLGAENLDSKSFAFPAETPRADYLLFDRTVVIELKLLTVDPRKKIDERIDEHLEKTGGIVYGEILSTQLFENKDESDAFHKRIIYAITRNTEAICRKANKQIRNTKLHLELNATGVLIILNEGVETLDPEVVAYRVIEFMNEKSSSIDHCLLIFESHLVIDQGSIVDPMLHITNGDQSHRSRRQLRKIMQAWALYNGQPCSEGNYPTVDSMTYFPRRGP
jgi:hypothetical protein